MLCDQRKGTTMIDDDDKIPAPQAPPNDDITTDSGDVDIKTAEH
jgi:hypothetical protein